MHILIPMCALKRSGKEWFVTMKKLLEDINRYNSLTEMPRFQKYMRKGQEAQNQFCRLLYKALFAYCRNKNLIEMPLDINIGGVIFRPSILHYDKPKSYNRKKLQHT